MDLNSYLKVKFFDSEWVYNIILVGYYIEVTAESVKQHYIFESHGEQIDIVKNSNGELTANEVSMPADEQIKQKFILFKNGLLEKMSNEDFVKTKWGNKIYNETVTQILGKPLEMEDIYAFDNVAIIFKKGTFEVPSFFGVNLIEKERLGGENVSREEFIKHLII